MAANISVHELAIAQIAAFIIQPAINVKIVCEEEIEGQIKVDLQSQTGIIIPDCFVSGTKFFLGLFGRDALYYSFLYSLIIYKCKYCRSSLDRSFNCFTFRKELDSHDINRKYRIDGPYLLI
jgi:hypothetical protein